MEKAGSWRFLLPPPGSHLAMVRLPLQCLLWGCFLTAVSLVSVPTGGGNLKLESREWEKKQYFGEGTFQADFGGTGGWVEAG